MRQTCLSQVKKHAIAAMDPRRILLIERDVLVRRSLSYKLRKLGHEVVAVSNCEEGLALLETAPDVQLVFSDIDFQDRFDGVELVRVIGLRWPTMRVLLTSA